MDIREIEKITSLAADIENFRECYGDCKIYPNIDGEVSYVKILAWLLDNPHMSEIAKKVGEMK